MAADLNRMDGPKPVAVAVGRTPFQAASLTTIKALFYVILVSGGSSWFSPSIG